MSFSFGSERLANARQDAQLLVERAGAQERHLEALVAAGDADVAYVEAAISHAAGRLSSGDVRRLLAAQLERTIAGAANARRLLTSAHHQLAAAFRLLQQLQGEEDDVRTAADAVLVVDDYGDVRELLARVLENAGFVVRTAENGLEALLAAYDMRISDIPSPMPPMDAVVF